MQKTGAKIKNIRLGLGLTVEDLSQKLGISRSYLTLVENEKRRLPEQLVAKFAKAFRLSKEVVYGWYLEQELREAGITDKKTHELIKRVLKMTPPEQESLLQVFREEKNAPLPPKK